MTICVFTLIIQVFIGTTTMSSKELYTELVRSHALGLKREIRVTKTTARSLA